MVLFLGLLLTSICAQAQEASPKTGWFASKPKKVVIDVKGGRGFLSSMAGTENDDLRRFYGGANFSFGLLLSNNFLGLGTGVEYVDMDMGAIDFPIFVNYNHYFSGDANRGFYLGAKAGYMFGIKKSAAIQDTIDEVVIEGALERSMNGLYGEVTAGYGFSGFKLFVAYNYRVIGYKTIWPDNNYGLTNSTSSRTMNLVMVGISFMVF